MFPLLQSKGLDVRSSKYEWFHDNPKISLTACYAIWKIVILCVAILKPGIGYDTSTILLSGAENTAVSSTPLVYWPQNFVRWDAIYFTQIASRGYIWEQEWAFGWGFTKLLAFMSKVLTLRGRMKSSNQEALAGILLSHTFHFLSVLILHELTRAVFPDRSRSRSRLAFIAASLHIISPAGIFLSAPCAESLFAFLNFFGFYLYTRSIEGHSRALGMRRNVLMILAGVVFGIATTFRGNGLLSGLLFIYDGVISMRSILRSRDASDNIRRLAVVGFSGGLMACIGIIPQYLAYNEYCLRRRVGNERRPWCLRWIPSVYAHVQKEYWNVGLFKYWTVPNLPLFLLAAPMLYMLLRSGFWAWNTDTLEDNPIETEIVSQQTKVSFTGHQPDARLVIAYHFAAPQVFLAILALTTWHVQIITRLASAYPVWYWWLAFLIVRDHRTTLLGRAFKTAGLIVKWTVIYAILQGALFASFLPPA